MRVLHVTHTLDPLVGGPVVVVRKVVREQKRLGHELSVLATDVQVPPPQPREAFKDQVIGDPAFAGVEIFLGKAYGRRRPFRTLGYSPECRAWLRRRLASSGQVPEVIHIHGLFAHVGSVAAAEARRRGIPYIIEPFGCLDSRLLHTEGFHRLRRLYAHLFIRKDMRHVAWVHPASEHEASEVRSWVAEERIRMIPHGVDLPATDLDVARQALLDKFPQLVGKRVVLFMSRVEAQKRPERVVAALARLRGDFPDLALLVCGNDSGHGHIKVLENTIRDHGMGDAVTLTGFVEGELWHGAFAVSELFVLPSKDENFGIAVIEAMAHRVPAVVSPGVAAHVHVDASGGGRTVEPTVESLANAIAEILRGDAKGMGQLGRQYVERHLSWPSIAQQIDTLYRDALNGRGT